MALERGNRRVKNNLHTIICLLECQADNLADDALQAIRMSQSRVYAMSLIHKISCSNEVTRTIDIASYLDQFIDYLEEGFGNSRIAFVRRLESVMMDIAQAIPVALIVNEAVVNAVKYAFPDDSSGQIAISFVSYS
ncbi:MAG: sensor histidine kinase [Ilumatobacteraceae bacterium]